LVAAIVVFVTYQVASTGVLGEWQGWNEAREVVAIQVEGCEMFQARQ
jgi:hypothetical protein